MGLFDSIGSANGFSDVDKSTSFDKKYKRYKKEIKEVENEISKQRDIFYRENQKLKRR